MRFLLFFAAFLVFTTAMVPECRAGAEIRSKNKPITVIDGDTIQIGGTVIQLAKIDAPELGQVCENNGDFWPCGLIGAYELGKLVVFHRGEIVCYPQSVRDGATVAECTFGDFDLSEVLLLDGVAVAKPHAPRTFAIAERKAREASLGVWRGKFVLPWEWRNGKRLKGEPVLPNAHEMRDEDAWSWGGVPLHPIHHPLHSGCVIKGKRGHGKSGLYYTPLDPGYADMKIDPPAGDRYFCSDDAARRAGWVRPNQVPQNE